MKKVYQKILDKYNGDCMQAAIASMLELELNEVPPFVTFGEEYWDVLVKFLKSKGYKLSKWMYNDNYDILKNPTARCYKDIENECILTDTLLYGYTGINGLHFASVLSPNNFNYKDDFWTTHAVVIDKDYNIVHDPNPKYKYIKEYPLAKLLGFNGVIFIFVINKIK